MDSRATVSEMNHPEDKIQYAMVMWLQKNGYYFYSIPNGDGAGNVARITRLISLGMRKGASDLVVLLNGGRSVYFEVKSSDGTQKPDQKLFQARLEERGHEYHLVRSLEEMVGILDGRR